MKKIYVENLREYLGEVIEFQGFVDKIRNLQYVAFVVLRDSSGKVQVTIEKNDDNKDLITIIDNLTLESTVKVKGKLLDSPSVKLNGMEIIPTEITLTSVSLNELPFDYRSKDNSLRETRLDYRFIDLRREENNLLFMCQTTILHEMRNFWYENGYIEINSPKISGASAESGAETFRLDYFGEEACLSQSPQFYKQMAIASGFDKVFEIGPAFRAENSHTSYHATEIQMIDAEIAWIDSVEDVIEMQESLMRRVMKVLKEKHGEEIKRLFKIEIDDAEADFPRITLEETKKILKEEFNYVGERELDLERKEELLICKYAKKKYNSDFVFITKWPAEGRTFYHMRDSEGYSNSYDLLYKGLEITTGAMREHRPDILTKQIIEKGLNPDDFKFYIDFFKYGCPPHGGFGFGLARLMMQIFEIDNIREATFIYRGPTRINP